MKTPILILFIIFNLLAVSMVSAMNVNEDTTESHLVHEQSDAHIVLAGCDDKSSCDHFCHISAHMMGFISQIAQLPVINIVIDSPVLIEQFHSFVLEPPFLPPQV